ncbi:MAG: NADPH:quinone oxidoreductase family protein [Burkholderiaceae bacterium]|nr:NADPH:quinone oxidoreductase family protein [Burkholderiaceae bacterium]
MHAWLCEQTTGPQDLQWRELPTPEPAAREVRVAVRCASLNFPDLLITQGRYQVRPPLPFVPGLEFSGVIDAVGSEVRHLRVGQRVASFGGLGGFAQAVCVAADKVLPIPQAMPFEEAAAFICTYATSHHALIDRAALRAGETVLVLGAAGGVGTAALQIAVAAGARVIAAASSAEKCELARRLGAESCIDYSREDLRERLKTLTEGRGPDVIYDPVGGDLAEPAFRSIAWRGRYLVVGFAQGQIPALPLNLALLKGASLVGVFWGDFARREPQAAHAALGELLRWYEEGRIRPVLDQVLPMSALVQGYARMASRQVQGKLVLRNAD